jgi:hypothetical protein
MNNIYDPCLAINYNKHVSTGVGHIYLREVLENNGIKP